MTKEEMEELNKQAVALGATMGINFNTGNNWADRKIALAGLILKHKELLIQNALLVHQQVTTN